MYDGYGRHIVTGPPAAALAARGITLLQAVFPVLVLVAFAVPLLAPDRRALRWSDLAWVLGAFVLAVAAAGSGIGMGSRRRWPWWGSVATNALTAAVWVAGIAWVAVDGARSARSRPPEDVDSGMVLVAFGVVGLPVIAVSLVAVVLLLLAPVRHYYLARV